MCWVMPPFSCAATSMPMIRSNSDVLPWSTWPRNVTIGGRGWSFAGSSSRFERLHAPCCSRFTARWKVTCDAQFRRQQFGHFGVERGGDVAHRSQFEQLGQDVAGGHAEGLGETPHRAGQLDDDVFAPRRRGVGAGPPDVRASPRRGDGRFLFAVFRLAPPDGGGLLAFELPLLAAAEGDGAFFFVHSAARRTAAAAGTLAAGSRRTRRARRQPSAGGTLCGARSWRPRPRSVSARACGCARKAACVPALPARMASRGSLMSGFCGAGSADFDRGGRFDGGQRRQLDRRAAFSFLGLLLLAALIRSFSFSLLFSLGPSRVRSLASPLPFRLSLFRSRRRFDLASSRRRLRGRRPRRGRRRSRLLLRRRRASRAWEEEREPCSDRRARRGDVVLAAEDGTVRQLQSGSLAPQGRRAGRLCPR